MMDMILFITRLALESICTLQRILMKKLSKSRSLAAKVIYAAFQILKENGGELNGREVIKQVGEKIELDEWAKSKNAYEFQDLAAALLRGMGYYTPFVAPTGKDGGVDIIAYRDPLGTVSPRIKSAS
jgi:predicted Mrr-cat superfamily restriction endonuclease